MTKKVSIENLSIPMNGTTSAKYDIQAGYDNVTIDGLIGNEHNLATCTFEYAESNQTPKNYLVSNNGITEVTLLGEKAKQNHFKMPWSACGVATNWNIHLNPTIPSTISANSNVGNLLLDLHEMNLRGLAVDTGGGNINLILPEGIGNLCVNARTGAGNMDINLPIGIAVRILASTRLGKLMIDSGLEQFDKSTYQTPNFQNASKMVEITASSRAGNVSFNFR